MHVLCKSYLLVGALALLALPRLAAADVPSETTEPVETPTIVSVEGAAWAGVDMPEGFVVTYRFERDGVVAYSYNGASYRNGTWRQDGDRIYFEMNGKYRECRATVRGDQIVGESWNRAGKKWKTDIRIVKSP